MKTYKTVIETVETLNVVKKSKFHSFLFSCETIGDFEKKLSQIKKIYPGATHYCYTYRIMDQVLLERYQDDGEPSGTAGLPMLNVLKGHELIQCGGVVVRYFGGIKLGTGGLASAYSQGIIDCVSKSKIVIKEEAVLLEIVVDYSASGKIDYLAVSQDLAILDTVYANDVAYLFAIRADEESTFVNEIKELTGGKAAIKEIRRTLGFFGLKEFIEK